MLTNEETRRCVDFSEVKHKHSTPVAVLAMQVTASLLGSFLKIYAGQSKNASLLVKTHQLSCCPPAKRQNTASLALQTYTKPSWWTSHMAPHEC